MEEPPVVIGDTSGASPSVEQHPGTKKPRLQLGARLRALPCPAPRKKITTKMTKRQKRNPGALPEPCSPEDVLWLEIRDVLSAECVDAAFADGIALGEMELEVVALCSTGGPLATSPALVVVIPGGLPGEPVRVRPSHPMYFALKARLIYPLRPPPTRIHPPLAQAVRPYGYRTEITPYFKAPNKHQRAAAAKSTTNGDQIAAPEDNQPLTTPPPRTAPLPLP
ncbi:hypothetical protein C8J57DRAFT_1599902 [Mycena rebaudengoi]|nr:hypothetical protein C8J57DRAFT_1599902 [Mycena rebaudengoi]